MRACCAFLAPSEHRSEAAVICGTAGHQKQQRTKYYFILEFERCYVIYERLNLFLSYVCLVV